MKKDKDKTGRRMKKDKYKDKDKGNAKSKQETVSNADYTKDKSQTITGIGLDGTLVGKTLIFGPARRADPNPLNSVCSTVQAALDQTLSQYRTRLVLYQV